MVTENGRQKRSYRKWHSMLRRCYDPGHPAYPYYAAKGIRVCERWQSKGGYDNFVADLGEPPEGLTLERIDNDGNYEPGNCKWATWKEQAQNRKARPQIPGSLRQLARVHGITYSVLYMRVKRAMWPLEKALNTPIGKRG